MKTCETCAYWEEEHERYFNNIHICRKPVEFWNATEWVSEKKPFPPDGVEYEVGVDRKIKPEHKDLKIFTQDASSYEAYILTRNDFFCAHWEEMDE